MAKTPSPLHTKRIPKTVSKPTVTAEAAATVAEAAVAAAPAPRKARAQPVPKKTKPAAKKTTAAPAVKKVKAQAEVPVVVPEAPAKPAKVHKPKLVRDSFTIPKDEYQVLDALKGRALGLEQHVRKSELLRAGIRALNEMDDRAFLKAIGAVPTLKTGRPKID